jgi:hypothetical protein
MTLTRIRPAIARLSEVPGNTLHLPATRIRESLHRYTQVRRVGLIDIPGVGGKVTRANLTIGDVDERAVSEVLCHSQLAEPPASAAADIAGAKTLDQGIDGKFKSYSVPRGTSPTPTTPGTGR